LTFISITFFFITTVKVFPALVHLLGHCSTIKAHSHQRTLTITIITKC